MPKVLLLLLVKYFMYRETRNRCTYVASELPRQEFQHDLSQMTQSLSYWLSPRTSTLLTSVSDLGVRPCQSLEGGYVSPQQVTAAASFGNEITRQPQAYTTRKPTPPVKLSHQSNVVCVRTRRMRFVAFSDDVCLVAGRLGGCDTR